MKIVSKWFRNGFKMVSKWFQNGFEMVSKWFSFLHVQLFLEFSQKKNDVSIGSRPCSIVQKSKPFKRFSFLSKYGSLLLQRHFSPVFLQKKNMKKMKLLLAHDRVVLSKNQNRLNGFRFCHIGQKSKPF